MKYFFILTNSSLINKGYNEKNQLTIVKEYEFSKPFIHKIETRIDNCYRDCHNKPYHTFEYISQYDINLENFAENEMINMTISGESMGFYELNKKITVASQRGYIYNQIFEITKKIFSNLSQMNTHSFLKLQIPIMHRHFFKIKSHTHT